jgi:hypothetical protein
MPHQLLFIIRPLSTNTDCLEKRLQLIRPCPLRPTHVARSPFLDNTTLCSADAPSTLLHPSSLLLLQFVARRRSCKIRCLFHAPVRPMPMLVSIPR